MVDVLITGGSVIDGAGQRAFTGDIAVKDGKIIAVAPKLSLEAARVIDAAGLTVIPGLIDPHVHEEYVCLLDGGMELFLRQGVTTCLNGNCGHAIFNAPTRRAIEYYWHNGLFSDAQRVRYAERFPEWTDFDGYARYFEQCGCNMNMASLQGHGTIRWSVMGGAMDRRPTPEEKAQIDAILRRNMEQGAWGVSFGLTYVPSRYADTDELCDVVDVIAEYDGVAAAHLRHYIGIKACTDEFIEVGRRTGARVQLSHLTPTCVEAFDAIRAAGDAGMRIAVDTIPRSTGHLTRKDRMIQFIVAVSDTLFSRGEAGVKAALASPEGRAMVLRDAYMFPKDRSKLFIVSSDVPEYENRSVADIAASRHMDPDALLCDLLADDRMYTFYLGGAARADFPNRPHDARIMQNPYVCVGSDELMGDPEDMGGWYELQRRGAMPIFHQMYRAAGISAEEIVRRNTSMIADHLGIPQRGRIAVGNWADIAILDLEAYRYPDPETIDYRDPHTMATGVHTVLVNGAVTLDDGALLRPYAGKLLRHGRC